MPSLFNTPINSPFDPASLRVEVKNTTIGQLVDMLKRKLINMQPDFQRHGNLWNKDKKSRLIESIILGLPLPSFYFYVDEKDEKWVVIDGLQRLCAISDFMVEQNLKLSGLQFLGEMHNKYQFEDFSYFEQLDMLMRPVTLNVISGASSAEAKYIIFQRINSEGTQLSPAEIRNALFHGKAMDLIRKLAESQEFEKTTNNGVSQKRLLHYDYVSRFIAFYVLGYEDYPSNNMDKFIGNALDVINKDDDEDKMMVLSNVFYNSLSLCYSLLGTDVFRQPLSTKDKKLSIVRSNPISISLFEAMMYSVSVLSVDQQQKLLYRKDRYCRLYYDIFKDEFLQKELSNGTNKYKSVYYRFSKMEELVKSVLK